MNPRTWFRSRGIRFHRKRRPGIRRLAEFARGVEQGTPPRAPYPNRTPGLFVDVPHEVVRPWLRASVEGKRERSRLAEQ